MSKTTVARVCALCFGTFQALPSEIARGGGLFCTRSCWKQHRAQTALDPANIAARFWTKVNKSGRVISRALGHCWEWTGKQRDGYGRFVVGKRAVAAHRLSWEITRSLIPTGLIACHRCDNPLCVNPDHLFLGTDADNAADRDAKGRQFAPRGEKQPKAKLTDESVRAIRAAFANGASKTELALEHNVTRQLIHGVVLRRIWRHVA